MSIKNIITLADSIFNANRNTNFNLSVQHLTQICSYVAEMLTASETRRGELETVGLTVITQEIFGDECDPCKEDEVAKIAIDLLDGLHIEDDQGILFDIINDYVQHKLYTNETRACYNRVFMSALVNAIRIKDKVKLYVETSFNNIFNRACDIVAGEGMHKIEMSELLFSGKLHAIMNIFYNFPKVIEGVQNAYLRATTEQFCNPRVDTVTKKAFEGYLNGFDRTVKKAIADAVERGPRGVGENIFFEPYIDEAIDMLKLILGR